MALAVQHACFALLQRHKLEEGAHAPAITALSRALNTQGTGLHEKVQALQDELVQCYRAQSQVSEQLVEEVAASKVLRAQLSEKAAVLEECQAELHVNRERALQLEAEVGTQSSALEVAINENLQLRQQVQSLEEKVKKLEGENKMLIDRWMSQKMQDAERLNEANAMYEDLMERLKAGRLEELARQQVDGIVRNSEIGAEDYVELKNPTVLRHTLQGHEGGCGAVHFEHNSEILVSGGNDRLVKIWDTNMGTMVGTLSGCLGSVLDLALPSDNNCVLGASSDHKLYLWEIHSRRIRHTLTGHTEKVSAVDISKLSNKKAISAAYDRTLKIWDLHKGYGITTIICHSNCNSGCLTTDATLICSGHMDGNLRFWDTRTGKLANEIAAHAQGITSVSLSRSGQTVLTSGRDNVHNLFDVRSMEICATFKAQGHRVPTYWNRSCISADENYVAAGSADGVVLVWGRRKNDVESILKGHASPVIACAWSDMGKPLATTDKSGLICLWQ